MYELTVSVEFEAAHRIIDYPGKCNRLHGHNWIVEVSVAGKQLNKLGMLVDFKDLKREVKEVVDTLDHVYLNELEAFSVLNPTAEYIAKYIYDSLVQRSIFNQGIAVQKVKVWESPKSAVAYSRDDENV